MAKAIDPNISITIGTMKAKERENSLIFPLYNDSLLINLVPFEAPACIAVCTENACGDTFLCLHIHILGCESWLISSASSQQ
jgi:hypothetical protein